MSPFSASPSWNGDKQGQFILSLTHDLQGNLWVGTEERGVWRFSLKSSENSWTQFTSKDGLGDDNAYALACDKAGRIWAGTNSHGVSVFNGKVWKTYDQVTGPLGAHVTALAVSPLDGSVWGATEAGLFRYKGGAWTYSTRANGLPSDQASALAFDTDGTLYVGTQCSGIAIASPHEDYKTWHIVSGPQQMPASATGEGLPSGLINCLLVTANGTVFAGTSLGLAGSNDKGMTWSYRRGVDWKDKLTGLYHPVTPETKLVIGDLLSEDYVTCLSEDGSGHLFIGHRQGGVEVFDPKTGMRVQSGANGAHVDDYVEALLVENNAVWVGLYGGGLLPPAEELKINSPPKTVALKTVTASYPPLPLSALPPTSTELTAMLMRVHSLTSEIPIGGGAYLGEDWVTQGDWVGRYGSRYAVLCAAAAPLDQYVLSDPSYIVKGLIGPHHQNGDGLRSWCQWITTNDPRVLWDPITGSRRESEWDDHGEDYSQTFAGPDVWVRIIVPAGLHRLSLYLMNKDGHFDRDRCRDYSVELKTTFAGISKGGLMRPGAESDPDNSPSMTQARVRNFWFGVYERFLVRGPSTYLVKVGRNGSFNTIVQSIMLDKISGPPTAYEKHRSIWYGNDLYHPPSKMPQKPTTALATSQQKSPAPLTAAQGLWDALDQSQDKEGSSELLHPFQIIAYRAAVASKTSAATEALLANWRWQLCLWTPEQRQAFQEAMNSSWQFLLKNNPKLAAGNQ